MPLPRLRARASALLVVACMAAACADAPGAGGTTGTTGAGTSVPAPTQPGTASPRTPESVAPTAAPGTHESVAPTAAPRLLDCTEARIVGFGNSIDGRLDNPEAQAVWADDILADVLNARADVDHLTITSYAVPGATIVGPSPLQITHEFAALVTAVPAVMQTLTPDEQRHLIVVIDPSYVELDNLLPGDTEAIVVRRALEGIRATLRYLEADTEVQHVIVFPTPPVHEKGVATTNATDMGERIAAFNAALAEAGITPPTMAVNPLVDPATGFGAWRFYDEFENLHFDRTPDGVHPDIEGHTELATAIAALPEMQAALADVCS